MPPTQFTREEADELLPRLTQLLAEMRERKTEYNRFAAQAVELSDKMRGNGQLAQADLKGAQEGLEQAVAALNGLGEQISELGCELKDIDQGLIDFRTEMDGKEVYLCWKLGEERVEWWHELDTGFAGRQPLGQR
ncbi:MAG: DUF2203 family protein [Chloroflexi bacterium]|nr:MAG: DUF2203 family protein [Chloroflexota bacterium]